MLNYPTVLDEPQIIGSVFSPPFETPEWAPQYTAVILRDKPATQPIFFYQQRAIDHNLLRKQLQDLSEDYVFSNNDALKEVLQQVPALYRLLKGAVKPLHFVFGENILLRLDALESDEGNILRVSVKLRCHTENAAPMMRAFKRDWWLKRCARSEGALVFDYETDNGF